jgi:hypothetical protein
MGCCVLSRCRLGECVLDGGRHQKTRSPRELGRGFGKGNECSLNKVANESQQREMAASCQSEQPIDSHAAIDSTSSTHSYCSDCSGFEQMLGVRGVETFSTIRGAELRKENFRGPEFMTYDLLAAVLCSAESPKVLCIAGSSLATLFCRMRTTKNSSRQLETNF